MAKIWRIDDTRSKVFEQIDKLVGGIAPGTDLHDDPIIGGCIAYFSAHLESVLAPMLDQLLQQNQEIR